MNNIKEYFSQKNWEELMNKFTVKDICLSLNFSEAMHLSEHLYYDDFQNDENQQFALKLVFEIKSHFKQEWENDWKNEIFLGELCSILWLYDEEYFCYKRAYDMLSDPPAELLLLLSGCNFAPEPPISDDESEDYLRKAISKKITYQAALMMRSLFKRKGNQSEENYWDRMYKKLEKENVSSELLIPDVLKK